MKSLHTVRHGSGRTGPTLVFLHHGLGSVSLWRDFPAKLGDSLGLPVLIYDRLGYGQSPPHSGQRGVDYLHREAEVLAEMLRTHEIDDSILIGHSDGGSIALLHSAIDKSPRAIVSIASHLFVEDITRSGIRDTVDSYRTELRAKLVRHHGAKTDHLFYDWSGRWLSPTFDAFDIRAEMKSVTCPVLALQGANDQYGTVLQLDAIASLCGGPVTKILVPNSAHEPHTQAAAVTFSAILKWISALA